MSIDKSAQEILFTFDIIKSRLNELIIMGMDTLEGEKLSEILNLKEKLENMKLYMIVDLLDAFISSLEQHDRSTTAKNALRIISTTRMFESIMNVELIKKDLLKWMELDIKDAES